MILNTDASFLEEDHSGSCGAVIRDHAGGFVAASTAKLDHVADVVVAESAALAEGLKLALSLGINSIIARLDNQVVVDALKHNTG